MDTRIVSVTLGLLLILVTVDRCFAFSCKPCKKVNCGRSPTCRYEVIKDRCGCCDVCAKGPGERCGGPWRRSGRCSKGLNCQVNKNIPGSDFNKPGICVGNVQKDELRYLGWGGFHDPYYAPGEVAVPGETSDTVDFFLGEGGVKCDTSCRGVCVIRDSQCRCMQNVTCFEIKLKEPSSHTRKVPPPGCPQLMECKNTCAHVVQWPDGWCLCHKDPICLQWRRRVRREKRQAQRTQRKSTRQAARIAKREERRKALREARRAKKHMRNGKLAKMTRHQTKRKEN